ncbi:hypothetical protein AAC387_Pa04g1822 [Persea americana]
MQRSDGAKWVVRWSDDMKQTLFSFYNDLQEVSLSLSSSNSRSFSHPKTLQINLRHAFYPTASADSSRSHLLFIRSEFAVR